MFRIKICGITNIEDAVDAANAGADAIGLNFFRKSPRYIAAEPARRIVTDIDGLTACVGVFVNEGADKIETTFVTAQLDGIQLHGDESPAAVADLANRLRPLISPHPLALLRVRRIEESGVAAIANDLEECRDSGFLPAAVLVDAAGPGQYGGTGKTLPWLELADHRRWLGDTPLILAGGLTPDNVAEAIRIVRPHGVDVASGVESAPGKKDPHKVRDFIAAARAAFDAL